MPALFSCNRLHASNAYPNKAIRFIVPSTAGSPVDTMARKLADFMSARLRVPVVVINKPGATGSIGATEVAKSAPDGYTLLFTVGDPLLNAVGAVKSLPYDPKNSFSFISKLVTSSTAFAARGTLEESSLQELLRNRRDTSQELTYGSYGPGSFPVVLLETMARKTGLKLRPIPYRAAPVAVQAALSGEIDLVVTAASAISQFVADRRMKPLAVVGDRRSPLLPQVPTFSELGLNEFVFRNRVWAGLLGPSGLSPDIVQRLYEEIMAASTDSEFQSFIQGNGFELETTRPLVFKAQHSIEYDAIDKALRQIGG